MLVLFCSHGDREIDTMTKGIEKKNASFLAVPMPCVKTTNHAHICLLCFCLHGPVCFAGRKETKGRETAPTPET